MANKIFLDSDVLLDYLQKRNGFYEEIHQIMKLAEEKELDVYSSDIVLINVIYFISKENTSAETKMIIKKLLSLVEIIYPNHQVINQSIQSAFSDIEDAVQYYTALHKKQIGYFITRNKKDFKEAEPELPVATPKEFLKIFYP